VGALNRMLSPWLYSGPANVSPSTHGSAPAAQSTNVLDISAVDWEQSGFTGVEITNLLKTVQLQWRWPSSGRCHHGNERQEAPVDSGFEQRSIANATAKVIGWRDSQSESDKPLKLLGSLAAP